MIIITINHNSDEVSIQDDSPKPVKIGWRVRNPGQVCSILEEVLNRIRPVPEGVRIDEINEDHQFTKEEW